MRTKVGSKPWAKVGTFSAGSNGAGTIAQKVMATTSFYVKSPTNGAFVGGKSASKTVKAQ